MRVGTVKQTTAAIKQDPSLLMAWTKNFWSLNEEDLYEIGGVDMVLYLTFIKYAAILFGISKPSSL